MFRINQSKSFFRCMLSYFSVCVIIIRDISKTCLIIYALISNLHSTDSFDVGNSLLFKQLCFNYFPFVTDLWRSLYYIVLIHHVHHLHNVLYLASWYLSCIPFLWWITVSIVHCSECSSCCSSIIHKTGYSFFSLIASVGSVM